VGVVVLRTVLVVEGAVEEVVVVVVVIGLVVVVVMRVEVVKKQLVQTGSHAGLLLLYHSGYDFTGIDVILSSIICTSPKEWQIGIIDITQANLYT
jgi:hypothetical protein